MGSVEFARKIEDLTLHGMSSLTFIIGGAYGVSQELANQVNMKLSLSKMTMSHQVVRLMFFEQLYRAFTILRNEPYHH
jgi:23S rRNA (pseudouridine1915-N3)-methyltransferase